MFDNLTNYLNKPLKIGNRSIEKRLVLAPMTFLGHIAFRELISRYGGYGLLFSEMCNSKIIPHENRFVSPYFRWRDEERSTLVLQIFGADPVRMADAARRIEHEGLFGVDINFGCSDTAICRQNCGAALLQKPDLAVAIVAEVRRAIAIPLTVKFRTGWQDDVESAGQLAKRFEAAGADALTFHPRVAPDRRSRAPKWEYIGVVKQSANIPVFGNGDVFDRSDCLKMLQKTGCDGVALGRMAIARPWIFAELTENLQTGPEIFKDAAVQLAELIKLHYDPIQAIKRFKRFAFYFSANFRFGHSLYCGILNSQDMEEVQTAIHRFFEKPQYVLARPNLNFFK